MHQVYRKIISMSSAFHLTSPLDVESPNRETPMLRSDLFIQSFLVLFGYHVEITFASRHTINLIIAYGDNQVD